MEKEKKNLINHRIHRLKGLMGSISSSVQDGAIHVKKPLCYAEPVPELSLSELSLSEQLGLLKPGKIPGTATCGPEVLCMEQSLRNTQSKQQQQPGCTAGRRNHFRNLTETVMCCCLENPWRKQTSKDFPQSYLHSEKIHMKILQKFLSSLP